MPRIKVKWKVKDVKNTFDLDPNQFLYTSRIIPFIKKVTAEEILDDLHNMGLLTKEISELIHKKMPK